jgi:hypothetical protein
MFRAAGGHIACSIRQLPGNKQPALAADLHACKSLVEARNQAAHSLRKSHGLRVAVFGLPVIAHHRFAVLVHYGRAGMVERRVELHAIGSTPAGVVHFVLLVGLSQSAGAYLDVLIAQCEGSLHNSPGGRHAGGQLDSRGSSSRVGRRGSRCCGGRCGRLGRGLGYCGNRACRQEQNQC